MLLGVSEVSAAQRRSVKTEASRGQLKYMNSNFINYHFDGTNFDADPYIRKYKVQGYPTLLFLAPDGSVLSSNFGSLGYTDMKKMAQNALSKYKNRGS